MVTDFRQNTMELLNVYKQRFELGAAARRVHALENDDQLLVSRTLFNLIIAERSGANRTGLGCHVICILWVSNP